MAKTIFFQTCLGVFQGGGCRAAAFVGAVEEAEARGVHFAEIAGTSAGSIVAALLGAGATGKELRKRVSQLDFRTLIGTPDRTGINQPPKKLKLFLKLPGTSAIGSLSDIYFFSGLHSSQPVEEWVETQLVSLLEATGTQFSRPVKFGDLPIPTWVVAADVKTKRLKIWSSKSTPLDEVAPAVRASCSIPIYFQPVDARYVDGGVLSNLPAFVFASPSSADRPFSSRVLAFTLEANEEASHSTGLDYMGSLISTVIDGSRDLQLEIQRSVHLIKIDTGDIRATDFQKMTQSAVDDLIAHGKLAAQQFFDSELQQVKTESLPSICADIEEMYSFIVEQARHQIKKILIAEHDTKWVYSLFPILLYWRKTGVSLNVVLKSPEDDKAHGDFRLQLLRTLGANVTEASHIPARAYLFDYDDPDSATALVGVPRATHQGTAEAVRYSGKNDFPMIDSLAARLQNIVTAEALNANQLQLTPGSQDRLFSRLHDVSQYRAPSIKMSVRSVPLTSLVSLTRYVREFKYRQIHWLAELFKRQGFDLFEPVTLDFGSGKESIITPPVVESAGDKFVLIEGTTRAAYCRDLGLDQITAVVVEGVADPLPGELKIPIKWVRMVGRLLSVGDRYNNMTRSHFRSIEKSVHPLNSL